MKKGTSNPNLRKLIEDIKENASKEDSGFWRKIATELEKSRRKRRQVTISRINKVTKDNETIVVPGKVLGDDNLNHNVKVAALEFSSSAKKMIKDSITIRQLLKTNPKAKDIRIIG